MDEQGRSCFQLLQARINRRSPATLRQAIERVPVCFMVFDVLACNGFDLRGVTLQERKRILEALLPESPLIRNVETLSERGQEFFDLVSAQNLEGIVAKQANSTYQSRRTRSWLKVKSSRTENFVIGGFTNPSGSRRYFGALLLGLFNGNQLVYVGRVGTGFNSRTMQQVLDELEKREIESSPFQAIPKEVADSRWVKPQLVCEVEFNEWTRDGILRAPSFSGLRPGIEAADCLLELPEDVSEADEDDELAGFPFLSNLDKVFWPEQGYTKKDLITYYYRISPAILPYLRNRPMNLERYPDGYQGKSFYQKDTPDFFPDWIRTVEVRSDSKEKPIRYTVCDDRDTLVYLANLACIPLHPWSSQIETLECPDFAIIDLDPDPSVPFPTVCRFANKVRQVLDQLGLVSFPKTSGSKGIHVLVPLEPRYDYAMVRGFSEIVARLSVHGMQEIATFDRSMKARKGKIYVDFLQNGMGKTIVSPYCVRPRPAAPVATPLEWGEVGPGIRPEAFHIKNILRRLERKGDPFEKLLQTRQELEPALRNLENVVGQNHGSD